MKKFFFGGRKDEKGPSGERPGGDSSLSLSGLEQVDPLKIKLLLDTMAEVISSIDPGRLLVSIVDRCIRLVDAERGILFLKGKDGKPAVKVARDASGRDITGGIQYSTRVVSAVFETGEPVLLKVGASEPADFSKSVVDLKLRAVMCVTLSVKDRIIGVIYVDSRVTSREFMRSDLKFFDALANAMAITIENARLVAAYVRNERLKESIQIARRIQADLLPGDPEDLESFDIAGRLQPLEETAGDYYDFIPLGGKKLGIVVADVAGHGIGPAILMASVRSLTRALLCREFSIDEVLAFLNKQIEKDTEEGIFVTYFLGVLDLEDGSFFYGNAGHPPPLLFRKGSGRFEELERTGMALGVVPDAEYLPAGRTVIGRGDILALFTDGIPEARRGGEVFGFGRFKEILRAEAGASASGLIDKVFASVGDFIGEGGSCDDLTLSVVKGL